MTQTETLKLKIWRLGVNQSQQEALTKTWGLHSPSKTKSLGLRKRVPLEMAFEMSFYFLNVAVWNISWKQMTSNWSIIYRKSLSLSFLKSSSLVLMGGGLRNRLKVRSLIVLADLDMMLYFDEKYFKR